MSKEDGSRPDLDGDNFNYDNPFRVIVVTDYRDEEAKQATGNLEWQRGWCLGLYSFPDLTKKAPAGTKPAYIVHTPELGDDSEVTLLNPLIFTDNGHFIWGVECDFGRDIEGLDVNFIKNAKNCMKQAIRITTGGFSAESLGKN